MVDSTDLHQTASAVVHGVSSEGITRVKRAAGHDANPVTSSTLALVDLVQLRKLGLAPKGIVFGSAVHHVEIPYGSYFHNQELVPTTRALHAARCAAIARMVEETKRLEAHGVLYVRLEVEPVAWDPNAIEIRAQGTAIVFVDQPHPLAADQQPFTCNLNVSEYRHLCELGMRPNSLVFGNSVFHIAHEAVTHSSRHTSQDAELHTYTQALANSREVSLARMEDEARALNTSEVVGVRISESSHAWRSHVLEYFAIGTAVVPQLAVRSAEKVPTVTSSTK
jgi:uncharacterized protein YbjQ (UPF0145 family)